MSMWPKPYLLKLYSDAVEHGFIWVGPMSKADGDSLRAAFHRLRRNDPANAGLLDDAMRLCSMTPWSGDTAGLAGRSAVIYSKLPSGGSLPTITPASPDELAAARDVILPAFGSTDLPEPDHQLDMLASAAEIRLSDEDVGSFVERMRLAAASRADDGGEV